MAKVRFFSYGGGGLLSKSLFGTRGRIIFCVQNYVAGYGFHVFCWAFILIPQIRRAPYAWKNCGFVGLSVKNRAALETAEPSVHV